MAWEGFFPGDKLDALFAKYDADGSGAITFDEFQRLMFDNILLGAPALGGGADEQAALFQERGFAFVAPEPTQTHRLLPTHYAPQTS